MDKRQCIGMAVVLGIFLPALTLDAQNTAPLHPSTVKMASTVSVNPAATPNKITPAEPPKSVPSYQLYTYYGDRYRDPFIPLTGITSMDQTTDRPPQISSLLLKGIIQDAKGRMALLTSGVSSYILKGGRLYDGRNHMMKGISGVIKSSSVILIGSDRTVRELKVSVTL